MAEQNRGMHFRVSRSFSDEQGQCQREGGVGAGGALGSPNIFNFPFSLFKKFKIKRKFAYWLPLEFLLMGKQLMQLLREKMFNIVIMHILNEKMCRIGRLTLNPLS